jgi:hypothetical protein
MVEDLPHWVEVDMHLEVVGVACRLAGLVGCKAQVKIKLFDYDIRGSCPIPGPYIAEKRLGVST